MIGSCSGFARRQTNAARLWLSNGGRITRTWSFDCKYIVESGRGQLILVEK